MTDATIRHAREVGSDRLAAFYRATYPGRPLEDLWPWLYRATEPDSAFPLVTILENNVVAHAGGIPFIATFAGCRLSAAWFVDFAVLPQFQRRGLGAELTKRWMDASELSVTFCNDQSLAVFRRLGWVESSGAEVHRLLVRPFDHPRLLAVPRAVRGLANAVASPIVDTLLRRHADAEPVRLEPVEPGADSLFAEQESPAVTAVRDREYVAWRVDRSPVRADYRIYRSADVSMLVRLANRGRLDVLWIANASEPAFPTIRRMLAALARWALRHECEVVRYYPPSRALSDYLRILAPVVSRPRFAFWAKDAGLFARLRDAEWRWQLLDSDFEWV